MGAIEGCLMALLGVLLFCTYQRLGIACLKLWFAAGYHGEVFVLEPQNFSEPPRWHQPGLSWLFGLAIVITGMVCGLEWRLLTVRWLLLLLFASVAWFDAATGLIPDFLNLAIFTVGFFHRSYQPALWTQDLFAEVNTSLYWIAPLIFCFSHGLSFWLASCPYPLVGGGDLKFIAALVWMGLGPLVAVLLLASCSALLWAWILRVEERPARFVRVVRFGPFLATSAAYCLSFPNIAYGWFQGYMQFLEAWFL